MTILKKFNLSYSAYSVYKQSPLQFYYRYLSGVAPSDETTNVYGNAGNAVHSAMQGYIEGRNPYEVLRTSWDKFDLQFQKGFNGKPLEFDTYKTMVDNGIKFLKDYKISSLTAELKIQFPFMGMNIKGYIDVVSADNYLYDWKTDSANNHDKHKLQRMFYSWLIWKQTHKLSGCHWVYLRKLQIHKDAFTLEELEEFDMEIKLFIVEIQKKGMNINNYEAGDFKSPFNEYKTLCFKEVERRIDRPNINVTLNIKGNYVYLSGDVSTKLLEGLDFKNKFDLKNKFWMQKAVTKNARGVIDVRDIGTVHLFNILYKCFPIGLMDKVKSILDEYAEYYGKIINLTINDSRKFGEKLNIMPDKLQCGKTLRVYQKDSIDIFMKEKHGIINIATGGGKTFVAAEIIRQCDCNTLWIIDRSELLHQTKHELENMLGMDLGLIGNGVMDIKPITIATIQTLAKKTVELSSYLETVNFAVVDEYHKSAAETYQTVFRKLGNTEYRLGLTATVARDDGKEPILYALLGKIVYRISTKELIEQGYLVKPRIVFNEIPAVSHDIDYVDDYRKNIAESTERNEKIHSTVLNNPDKKILIITKLVNHGKVLNDMIKGSAHLHGSLGNEVRKGIMKWFRECNSGCLIMTLSIAAEGLDIPDLDVLVNASANKGDVKSVQVLGRLLRKIEGKDTALYVDFLDNGKHTKMHSKYRMKAFEIQGHEVLTE